MSTELNKNLKRDKVIYWIATGLISILFIGSALMYVFKSDMVKANMVHLNYPEYLTYILPFTKISGVVIILFSKWQNLKEWAYSGLFINCILAAIAHGQSGDGWINAGIIGAILVLVSYFFGKK